MMAVLRKAGMEWEPKYGPAFVLGVAQSILGLIIWLAAALSGYYVISENTRINTAATAKLEMRVDKQQTVLDTIGNRVTKIEATTDSMNHSLDRIEMSVQRLAFPPRSP